MFASTSSSGKGKNNTIDATIDLIAGSAGGCATVFVGQPLDTVKVKMQTFPTLYTNALKCFLLTYKTDGLRGLYAGTVPSLLANVAENSVLFAAYGICQKAVQFTMGKEKVSDLSVLENASSGFLAAFFSSLTLCPTELLKCKLQAMKEMEVLSGNSSSGTSNIRLGPWGLAKQIIRQDGFQGMFRGLTPTLAREMPGYFCFFGGYEMTRTLLTPAGKTKDDIGLFRTIIAGGVGGVSLWVSIFPADVVKSRVQVASSTEGMMSVMMRIIKMEGVGALYNGLGPTVVRTFPATGALFVAYEYSKKWMHQLTDSVQ